MLLLERLDDDQRKDAMRTLRERTLADPAASSRERADAAPGGLRLP